MPYPAPSNKLMPVYMAVNRLLEVVKHYVKKILRMRGESGKGEGAQRAVLVNTNEEAPSGVFFYCVFKFARHLKFFFSSRTAVAAIAEKGG